MAFPPSDRSSGRSPRSPTRRAVLAGTALTFGGALAGGSSARPSAALDADTTTDADESMDADAAVDQHAGFSVLTRNLSLGVDFTRLAAATTAEEVPRVAGALLSDIAASHPEERLSAIADEIAATDPALVGLQEVAVVETGPSGDGTSGNGETSVRYDFLELLLAALDERDLDYAVAAAGTTTVVETVATVDGDRLDARLTDRDVILARGDVETDAERARTFETVLRAPIGGETLTVARGYAACDARVADASFTFVTTHLESTGESIRAAQAEELRGSLDARDVVVAGDFNSEPGDPAYETLAGDFDDAWAVTRDGPGPTCCQAATLDNPDSRLSRRIDHVFVRGALGPTASTRVGADPESRLSVAGGDATLWPSDHAGVAATLRPIAPRATETPAPTRTSPGAETGTPDRASDTPPRTSETPTGTPRETTEGAAPGFGVVGTVAALALALFRLRRRGD